jgi:hypothetical protein
VKSALKYLYFIKLPQKHAQVLHPLNANIVQKHSLTLTTAISNIRKLISILHTNAISAQRDLQRYPTFGLTAKHIPHPTNECEFCHQKFFDFF